MMDQQQKIAPRGLSVEFVGEAQTDDDVVKKVLDGEIRTAAVCQPRKSTGECTLLEHVPEHSLSREKGLL